MENNVLLQEEGLIKKAQNGDPEALSELYRQNIAPVFKFIYSKVGNREEAEDLTQTTFLKMLDALSGFAFESKFRTWLYSIALNTVADHWRRYYKCKEVSLEDFLGVLRKKEFAIDEQDELKKEMRVKEILNGLGEDQRRVLELRFLKGYSIQETAAELSMTESNVKVLQHRAIKKAAAMNFEKDQENVHEANL
jgi:RNA polymerase sigma-70 factor (ECF subfamily)